MRAARWEHVLRRMHISALPAHQSPCHRSRSRKVCLAASGIESRRAFDEPASPLTPEEALLAALREHGLEEQSAWRDHLEEESWEDAADDFEDPWMRNPLVTELEEGLAALDRGGGGAEGQGSGAAPEYDAAANPGVPFREIGGGASGVGPPLLVLDVRSEAERLSSAARPPPTSEHVPLEKLTREVVAGLLGGSPPTTAVVVLDSGDSRARQAVVRLTRVFGVPEVLLATDWGLQDT